MSDEYDPEVDGLAEEEARPPAFHEIDEDACPVTPLGQRGGVYHFCSRIGEYRALSTREMTATGLVSLFDGETAWLVDSFPQYGRDGSPTGGFQTARAVSWLMRRCAMLPLWDAGMPIRGPGVWRGGDGGLIVHVGGKVRVGDAWRPAGALIDGALYPAAPAAAPPGRQPAPAAAGRRLLEHLGRWSFEREIGPDLVLGFIGQAMLGGAPSWRGHQYVTGPRGCGKSALARLVQAALGGAAHPTLNNFTEAGLRQAMTGEARALVLDESEQEEGSRVQAVIELLRHMSGAEGSRGVRGSTGGRAMGFQVTGSAWLSSILHVPLKPQDRSRITLIRLRKLPRGPDQGAAAAAVEAAFAEVAETSPALRTRAILGWARFQQTVAVYRDAFFRQGCDARQADQFAGWLAGRDLLTADHPPDRDFADEEAFRFKALIDDAAEEEEEGEGPSCLNRLYSSPVDLWRSGERKTVSQAVMAAVREFTDTGPDEGGRRPLREHGRALGTLGLRVAERREGTPGKEGLVLLVARQHVGLDRIFAGSRWEGGAWTQALGYLAGAAAWPQPERFAGAKVRATAVPADCLPREDEGGPGPEDGPDGSAAGFGAASEMGR